MTGHPYHKEITALLVVDPYNDFISEGGKIWPRIRGVAEANDCVPHMLHVLNAARRAKIRVFYALHHRYRPVTMRHGSILLRFRKQPGRERAFEYGTWGGNSPEFEPEAGEIVASEHWCSSGFANTDLDLQLKKRGIHQLIVIGLIAHTCIEATIVRFAAELGYDVTVVKDATADYSDEEMHAALHVNIPNYASAVVTTDEIVTSISAL